MSLHRRAAKRDQNEAAVIAALEAAGCTVQRLSEKGCPDLLVGRGGRDDGSGQMWLMEVKGRLEHLTADQIAWSMNWRGPAPYLVRSVAQALAVIGGR